MKILTVVAVLLLVTSILLTYYRFFVSKDYIILDNQEEAGFVGINFHEISPLLVNEKKPGRHRFRTDSASLLRKTLRRKRELLFLGDM